MKIRSGFVSNSSSSSFLLVAENNKPIKCGYNNIKLTETQKLEVYKQGYIEPFLDKDIYLTSHVSDTSSWEIKDDCVGVSSVVNYRDGGHGGPYDEENYIEIAENIWLWKGSNENT